MIFQGSRTFFEILGDSFGLLYVPTVKRAVHFRIHENGESLLQITLCLIEEVHTLPVTSRFLRCCHTVNA